MLPEAVRLGNDRPDKSLGYAGPTLLKFWTPNAQRKASRNYSFSVMKKILGALRRV